MPEESCCYAVRSLIRKVNRGGTGGNHGGLPLPGTFDVTSRLFQAKDRTMRVTMVVDDARADGEIGIVGGR